MHCILRFFQRGFFSFKVVVVYVGVQQLSMGAVSMDQLWRYGAYSVVAVILSLSPLSLLDTAEMTCTVEGVLIGKQPEFSAIILRSDWIVSKRRICRFLVGMSAVIRLAQRRGEIGRAHV